MKNLMCSFPIGESVYGNSIHRYNFLSGEKDNITGKPNFHDVKKSISVIFGIGSDLTPGGRSELDRSLEVRKNEETPVRVICVVD